MNIDRMISEYKNELATLKMALKKTDDLQRKMELAAEIAGIEEIIADLNQSLSNENTRNNY